MKKRRVHPLFRVRNYIILGVALILVVFVLVFSSRVPLCSTQGCFNSHLEVCDAARFVGGDELIFDYQILGKQGDTCEVSVKLLQADISNRDFALLQGQSMICSLPAHVIMVPESDISTCHGILKESLQDLLIQKLHNYIAKNIGTIGLEISAITA